MTRKEKKARLAEKKRLLQLSWCTKLETDMAAGVTVYDSLCSIGSNLSAYIKTHPQENQFVLSLWTSFNKRLANPDTKS